MLQDVVINNKVELIGEICSEFSFSHETYGEKFYAFCLRVKRLSDISDCILVTASDRILRSDNFFEGQLVYVSGQYRSYNNYSNSGNKLILTVFAKEMVAATEEHNEKNPNTIYLNGFICKEPIYRTTPFGREITDTLVAVNRTYNKSDYIPCIAWGHNARYTASLPVGTNVMILGRIQSREYQKRMSEEEVVIKTAYEVSISKVEIGCAGYGNGVEYRVMNSE